MTFWAPEGGPGGLQPPDDSFPHGEGGCYIYIYVYIYIYHNNNNDNTTTKRTSCGSSATRAPTRTR